MLPGTERSDNAFFEVLDLILITHDHEDHFDVATLTFNLHFEPTVSPVI